MSACPFFSPRVPFGPQIGSSENAQWLAYSGQHSQLREVQNSASIQTRTNLLKFVLLLATPDSSLGQVNSYDFLHLSRDVLAERHDLRVEGVNGGLIPRRISRQRADFEKFRQSLLRCCINSNNFKYADESDITNALFRKYLRRINGYNPDVTKDTIEY